MVENIIVSVYSNTIVLTRHIKYYYYHFTVRAERPRQPHGSRTRVYIYEYIKNITAI